MKIEESNQDIAGEYIKRYLILGSRIPFVKVPLFFIGALALMGKGVEKAIQAHKDKEKIATVVGDGTNLWTAE